MRRMQDYGGSDCASDSVNGSSIQEGTGVQATFDGPRRGRADLLMQRRNLFPLKFVIDSFAEPATSVSNLEEGVRVLARWI